MAACNGGDDEPVDPFTTVAGPANFVLSGPSQTPLRYDFPMAGTYELRATGDISCQQAAIDTVVNIWFSFAGVGVIADGDAYPQYNLGNCSVGASFTQTITIQITGSGPWQISMSPFRAQGGSVTVSGLRIAIRQVI
jgi:hypothetical protein